MRLAINCPEIEEKRKTFEISENARKRNVNLFPISREWFQHKTTMLFSEMLENIG
jgi:hypothetical protein